MQICEPLRFCSTNTHATWEPSVVLTHSLSVSERLKVLETARYAHKPSWAKPDWYPWPLMALVVFVDFIDGNNFMKNLRNCLIWIQFVRLLLLRLLGKINPVSWSPFGHQPSSSNWLKIEGSSQLQFLYALKGRIKVSFTPAFILNDFWKLSFIFFLFWPH